METPMVWSAASDEDSFVDEYLVYLPKVATKHEVVLFSMAGVCTIMVMQSFSRQTLASRIPTAHGGTDLLAFRFIVVHIPTWKCHRRDNYKTGDGGVPPGKSTTLS